MQIVKEIDQMFDLFLNKTFNVIYNSRISDNKGLLIGDIDTKVIIY